MLSARIFRRRTRASDKLDNFWVGNGHPSDFAGWCELRKQMFFFSGGRKLAFGSLIRSGVGPLKFPHVSLTFLLELSFALQHYIVVTCLDILAEA